MPRATWRGFLRLSLVSCPIYLSPATTRTKPLRLHQVWRRPPVDEPQDDRPDRDRHNERVLDQVRAMKKLTMMKNRTTTGIGVALLAG